MARLIWICILKGTRKNCESCLVIIFCTVWNNEVVKLTLYGVKRRSGIQDSFLFYQWAKVVQMKIIFFSVVDPHQNDETILIHSHCLLPEKASVIWFLRFKSQATLLSDLRRNFLQKKRNASPDIPNFKVFRGESPRYSRLRRREYSHPCSQMQLPNENLGFRPVSLLKSGLVHCQINCRLPTHFRPIQYLYRNALNEAWHNGSFLTYWTS